MRVNQCVSGLNVFPWVIVTFLRVSGQQNLQSAAHTVLLWESILQCKNANEVIDIITASDCGMSV